MLTAVSLTEPAESVRLTGSLGSISRRSLAFRREPSFAQERYRLPRRHDPAPKSDVRGSRSRLRNDVRLEMHLLARTHRFARTIPNDGLWSRAIIAPDRGNGS